MINQLRFCLNEFEVELILKKNLKKAVEIYLSNPGFFALSGKNISSANSLNHTDALSPTDDEKNLKTAQKRVWDDLKNAPDGFDRAKKLYFLIRLKGESEAVADLLTGYPTEDCLWLGLLLVKGELHGQGFGTRILHGIISAATTSGFKSIRLGVLSSNHKALGYWASRGFTKITTANNVVVFEKILGA